MPVPDFLQFHCANTDHSRCAGCPRDFILPVKAIEGIYKNADGKALITIAGCHYCPDPHCDVWLRFLHTNLDWATLVAMLDGKLENMGDCTMIVLP